MDGANRGDPPCDADAPDHAVDDDATPEQGGESSSADDAGARGDDHDEPPRRDRGWASDASI